MAYEIKMEYFPITVSNAVLSLLKMIAMRMGDNGIEKTENVYPTLLLLLYIRANANGDPGIHYFPPCYLLLRVLRDQSPTTINNQPNYLLPM